MAEYFSYVMRGYVENYTGLPKACWQAITLTFIESIAIGVCFFLSLYFVDTLHFEIATAGMLISCYGAGTVMGGMVSGKLSDQVSPKIVSAISLFLQAVAFLFLIELRSIEWLMLNLFMLGLSCYGFSTSNDVWMLNQCKGHSEVRLKTVNISRAAMNLGLGISGAIIGFFTAYGFQSIFYFFAAILFICSVCLMSQDREAHPLNSETKKEPSITDATTKQKKSKNKIILVMLGCLFLVGLLISQLSTTYPIYVQNAFPKLGIQAVSILFILDTVLIVIFQAPLVNFFKNANKIAIAGLGAFLMGLGMLILSISFTFALGVISCIIWTTGEMLFIPMAQLICYEKGAENKKGQSMGLYKAIYASSMIVGPALGGAIYQYVSGDVLWYMSFIIGVLCFTLCLYYKRQN